MVEEWKTCKNCKQKVNKAANECPYCNCKSFTLNKTNKYSPSNLNKFNLIKVLKYKLFYNKYEQYDVFIFSRPKFINVLAFCIISIDIISSSLNLFISLILILILFIPVYIITHFWSSFEENDSYLQKRIENMEDSLIDNVVHFLFYWYDKDEDKYIFSKTKSVSLLIYIIFILFNVITSSSILFSALVGLIVLIPSLLIGTLIHHLLDFINLGKKEIANVSSKFEKISKHKHNFMNHFRTEPKSKSEEKVSMKDLFNSYKNETIDLKSKFEVKEKNVRDLIEKRFPAPQLTNVKFNSIVDECCEVFNQKSDVVLMIVDSTTQYSNKIENEIESNINVLKEIITKIDNLTYELLIDLSEERNADVDDLLDDIDKLTDSIKDYK